MPKPCAAAPAAADPIAPTALGAARAALDRRLDPASRGPVALALSGGGDSLALLQLAAGWCSDHGRPLLALTVDHGLNPDSAAWTEAAGQAAVRVGADWRPLAWTGPKPVAGLPAAARTARHILLAEAAREAGAQVILTGHTRDDVLEGELMREVDTPTLGRMAEWSPSPVWPEGRGMFLLRPLLGERRAALRDWLSAQGLAWLDDPANDDLRFARARARKQIDQKSCRPEIFEAQGPCARPGEIDAHLLSAALLCASGTDRPPRGEPLLRLLARLRGGEKVQATLAGARVVASGRQVQIGREPGRSGLPAVSLLYGVATVWDGRHEITACEPGWTAAPLGGRMARLSPADRQRLKAIPAWARGAAPALIAQDGRVRLPAPLGDGPALATTLADRRLAAACGLIARESEIAGPPHGAVSLLTLC